MSDVHDIRQQQGRLAIFIKAEKTSPIVDALWPQDNEDFAAAPHFTKKALFTPITYFDPEEDKEKKMSFFQFERVADKLPEIAAYLAEKGDPLTAADFLAPHIYTKTAFEFIQKANGIYHLMDPNLWAGREEELGKLYDSLTLAQKSSFESKGLTKETLLREAAKAGGAVFRDEVLEGNYGVKLADILEAAKTGKFTPVLDKLKQHNDTLTKEDLMLAEVWAHEEVWEHYDQIHELLKNNGEALECDDLTQTVQKPNETTPSKIFHIALDSSHAEKLYDPTKWVGRSDDFRKLLREGNSKNATMQAKGISRGDLLAELAELEYKDQLEKRGSDAFLRPTIPFHSVRSEFNQAVQDNNIDAEQSPVTPLGLLSVWQALDETALDALEQAGTPLLPQHIESVAGYEGETGLTTAIRAGRIDMVLSIYQRAGHVLTPELLKETTKLYESPMGLIKRKELIVDLFKPEGWIGHTAEMKHLWEECLNVGSERDKVGMAERQSLVERLNARKRAQSVDLTPYGL